MSIELVDERTLAVFAVDPGNTTGVAGGFFEPFPTLLETLTEGRIALKHEEIVGDYLAQGLEIANRMWRFQYTANVEHGIALDRIFFVFEDFVLRRKRAGGATGNLTSCWVAAAAVSLYTYGGNISTKEVIWQQPSEAMFYRNKLKRFDMWVKGSEHLRVCNMHIAARVSKLLG